VLHAPYGIAFGQDFHRRRGKADLLALAAGIAATLLTAAAFLFIAPAAGKTAPGETAAGAIETFAGIPPVAYLVKRIGGPHVRVEVLVQPGEDPHIFGPTPRQVMRLSKARLFFKIGMPFEDRLTERIAASGARTTIIDTATGIPRRAGVDPDEDAGADPHVWLAPKLLKQMAANIAAALSAVDPTHANEFHSNQKSIDAELDALDRRLATSLAPYRGQAFYVFHPAFGYFADAYGLRQESVEIEGKPPTPRQLVNLIQQARADHVKIIFLQPRFNQQAAESIAQSLGGAVMPMDDLAHDVVANLNNIAATVENALRGIPEPSK
jgi:zinc transport system substrate-binding protein